MPQDHAERTTRSAGLNAGRTVRINKRAPGGNRAAHGPVRGRAQV